jgi:hypothetical protein
MTRSMLNRGYLAPVGRDFELTVDGRTFLEDLGIAMDEVARQRRMFARQCIDWTEREPHIAGAVGAAIFGHTMAQRWFERIPGSRALLLTEGGQAGLRQHFSVDVRELLFPPMPARGRGRAGTFTRN